MTICFNAEKSLLFLFAISLFEDSISHSVLDLKFLFIVINFYSSLLDKEAKIIDLEGLT